MTKRWFEGGPDPLTIKQLLTTEGVSVAVGASNAMIAQLAADAGADAIWLSSFELHAWSRLPDAAILGVADYADAVSKMADRVDLPIVVDGDEGGPSSANTIRAVREYEKNGASGIVIEDNPSPKRCSFYGMKKVLEQPEIWTGKLKAAKEKALNSEFAVIARTEALIQGHGMEVALERAEMVQDIGIDGFLIHCKDKTPDAVLEFAKLYHERGYKLPLVCVPTTYNQLTIEEMEAAGFSLCIYANYGVRATVKALRDCFGKMIGGGTLSAANETVVPMTDVFDILAVDEMKENQERYRS